MLTITVPGVDLYNEETQVFERRGDVTLELEHSLVSLSKWEQHWKTPFLGDVEKSDAQVFYYIQCMTLSPDVPREVYTRLSPENMAEINEYITDKRTATWFAEDVELIKPPKPGLIKRNQEVITGELIYYWMISHSVPFECQTWHLNTLLTLIKVSAKKNAPAKQNSKMTADKVAQRKALNEARKKQFNTSG